MAHAKKKPLTHCEKYGHSWMATPSPNYQKCSRPSCMAARRFHAGEWKTGVPQQGTHESTVQQNTMQDGMRQTSIWKG